MDVATIMVDPGCTRAIRGVSELRRQAYFALCDHGRDFDKRCRTPERYEYLVRENGVTFGRKLGVVKGLARWSKAVREDPGRPGFADTAFVRDRLAQLGHDAPGEDFRRDMGGRLEIAAHGHHNGFPEFMGKWTTEQAQREKGKQEWVPKNIRAAAELSAAALRYDHNDFDRPAFYEPVNEPHWSFPDKEHFQQWHLKTMEAVHRETPEVKVGGPCLSVPYFYGKQYRSFNGLKAFIDGTGCRLDFYSFHSYDYLRAQDGDFGGRITSGPPLESVLDLVQNHTVNVHGREVPLVMSEHGGYGAGDLVEALARKHFPGEGFEWEMRKRSIDDFNMVSSVLANTLVFMDHPHVVAKAVPFILLESMAWDPRYYAVLYSPRDYRDKSDWVPTRKILFHRFLRDLKGRRVDAFCLDPDLQVRAFVDGDTLFVVVNNLWTAPQVCRLSLPPAERVTVRRLGRRRDFTPYLTEGREDLPSSLTLQGREAILIKARYGPTIAEERRIDELPCYGDRIGVDAGQAPATFAVDVPDTGGLDHAVLRVGISRPAGTGREANITLNGRALAVPIPEGAARFEDAAQGYATCVVLRLAPDEVETRNTVTVSFPDGQPGSVGAVVIRAAYRCRTQEDERP